MIGEWTQWSACSSSDGSGTGFQQRVFQCKSTAEVCQQVQSPETRSCVMAIHDDMADSFKDRYLEGLFQGSKTDVALRDHNIKELLVSSETECALHCMRIPECSSINIGVQDSAHALFALLVCQLNKSTADSVPEDLVGSIGFNYYSVLSRHFGD
ncbi:hypothetical protein ACROYT_G006295 [Oculina patagonica]